MLPKLLVKIVGVIRNMSWLISLSWVSFEFQAVSFIMRGERQGVMDRIYLITFLNILNIFFNILK